MVVVNFLVLIPSDDVNILGLSDDDDLNALDKSERDFSPMPLTACRIVNVVKYMTKLRRLVQEHGIFSLTISFSFFIY